MADFSFELLTHSPDTIDTTSAALGDEPTNLFRTATDEDKAMKRGGKSNFVITQDGDDIEGFLLSIRGDTVNEGFSFGSVARGKSGFRVAATIGETQGETPAKVLDYVVSSDQAPAGERGTAMVRTGEPVRHLWRIVNMRGDGTAGTKVILEKNA